jgi:AcrR family transcriptional regulator
MSMLHSVCQVATPIRHRYRTQVRDEIKRAALRQLAEGGSDALSINAIAKELGVSGPALYRYFNGRDELLTELVVDAYDDLGDAVGLAAARTRGRSARDRLRALARAYREWALAHPHRYGLLFAEPIPGYDAHAQRLVAASQRAMNVLVGVLDVEDAGAPSAALARELKRWARTRGIGASAPVALRAVQVWTRLHGFVSLEIGGNFTSMQLDPDKLFRAELERL